MDRETGPPWVPRDPRMKLKPWTPTKKEEKNDLMVSQLNNKYFRTHLEDALSLGRPFLLEDESRSYSPFH